MSKKPPLQNLRFKWWEHVTKDYVRTSIFPREMGRKIGQAEEIRHASDYDDFYIASKEESERQISVADEFIILAKKYCMEQLQEKK